MGEVNAGLMLRFKDDQYVRPLVNIYYPFLPLRLPSSWGNAGLGGIEIGSPTNNAVTARIYSGPRTLRAGEVLTFTADFYLTPFRPLATDKQWSTRFIHPQPSSGDPAVLERALADLEPLHGPNVLTVHQGQACQPYINYPYSDDSFPALRGIVERAHARGAKARVYYTTRELRKIRLSSSRCIQ